MITQEQYDQLNEGDTVTARYESQHSGMQFEVTSKVYVHAGRRGLAGWYLDSPVFEEFWTIIEHIPATPAWHSAQVISATDPDGERHIWVRHVSHENAWVSGGAWCELTKNLKDVKILVDKDAEL